jgi:hypothetical protein
MENQNKSRNLSPIEYLNQLETEWYICNLRRKIYQSTNDRNYYNRVANLKRDRIKDICERNNIPSIFTSRELMQKLNKQFIATGGLPIFKEITENDIINYYYPNNDVRCIIIDPKTGQSAIKYAKTTILDLKNRQIQVVFTDNTLYWLGFSQVQRIF